MGQLELLKKKLEFVTSEAMHVTLGAYQKEKQKIEKKNKQRYWQHVVTFSEGNSIWKNKDHYLIIQDRKESIYKGKELPQIVMQFEV